MSEEINESDNWRLKSWFPDLDPGAVAKLKEYFELLKKFNRTLNLVSAKTIPYADALHFADSILASRMIAKAGHKIEKIHDFGSGNGFPGLVYGIIYPNVEVVLVDTDQRKCEFLKHVIASLELKNCSVLNKPIDALPDASIQYAVCRGLANITKALLMTRKCVQKGGVFFHLKGEEWGIEVSEIPAQLCSLWAPALVGEYRLPIGAFRFAVVKTEKIQ